MNKRYRKKSSEVRLVEYRRGEPSSYIRVRQDGTAYVWNELHHSEININDGDFVNITTQGDHYPITKEKVDELYEVIE